MFPDGESLLGSFWHLVVGGATVRGSVVGIRDPWPVVLDPGLETALSFFRVNGNACPTGLVSPHRVVHERVRKHLKRMALRVIPRVEEVASDEWRPKASSLLFCKLHLKDLAEL